MKKILGKLCSVRVILTVLCLLSFAMEARADIVDPLLILHWVKIGCLRYCIVFALILTCSIVLGYCLIRYSKLRPVMCCIRFAQIILTGAFFLMWVGYNDMGTFDLTGNLNLLVIITTAVCASLFSGIWKIQKNPSDPPQGKSAEIRKSLIPVICFVLVSLTAVFYLNFIHLPHLERQKQIKDKERYEQIKRIRATAAEEADRMRANGAGRPDHAGEVPVHKDEGTIW